MTLLHYEQMKIDNIGNFNKFMIEKMMNCEAKIHLWSHLAERARENHKKQECVTLLQDIETFLSEGCRKEECNKYSLQLLKETGSPLLFRYLLTLSIESNMGKGSQGYTQLMEVLTGLVDRSQKKEIRHVLGVSLLKNKGQLMSKIVESCRSCESRTQSLLALVCSVILAGIQRDAINNYNFTQIVLLASQCVLAHRELASSTLREAIKLLLIVDKVQKGQIVKIVASSKPFLNALNSIIQLGQLNGYVYYLTGKLLLEGGQKEKIQQICSQVAKKIENQIDIASELDGQIDKIRFNDNISREKVDFIQKIRGIAFFVSEYVSNQLKQGTITDKWVKIVERLLQIKDFQCFEHLLPSFMTLIEAGIVSTTLTPSIITTVQNNCLPLRSSKPQEADSSSLDIRFYSEQFSPSPHTLIAQRTAPLMLKLTQLMLQSRGCQHKRSICGCCQSYIHTTIQKQYQFDFNPHEFMSACHLMSRQISRIGNTGASNEQLAILKDYLINNLKWLLNLNESCLPQYRKWINFKVFDLLLVFPPFFQNNQFLREVVDELLIGRLPQTLGYLQELVGFYQKEKKEKELLQLREKLMRKITGEGLGLGDLAKLWSIMVERTQGERLKEYIDIQAGSQESQLARYLVISNKKLGGLEKLGQKAEEIKTKWESYPTLYEEELDIYRKYRQSL